MPAGRYLIVDGHSVIFAWPELVQMHRRRSAPARERLIKCLRDYQDWTGVRVVVVFDGTGSTVSNSADPGDIQIFYSARGQTADSVVELLDGEVLTDVSVCAGAKRGMHLLLIVTDAGEDHNRQLGVDLTDEGDKRNAVYFWHLKIDNRHVAIVLREPVRGLESIGERLTGVA